MNDYVDLNSFVADYDRREDCQAALRGDVTGDDDELNLGDVDTDTDSDQ